MNQEEFEFLSSATQHAKEILGDQIRFIIERFAKRAESVSAGRNRITFLFPTYVIKVPRCWNGVADNDWEGSINKSGDYIQYARTRLAYYKEIPILFMERVNPASYNNLREKYGKIPNWVDCVDCGQVGWNRSGKLVAYDYGCR